MWQGYGGNRFAVEPTQIKNSSWSNGRTFLPYTEDIILEEGLP